MSDRLPAAPEPSSPGVTNAPTGSLPAAILAVVGSALVVTGSFLDYVRIPGGGPDRADTDLSIADCQFEGCGWFMAESLGLAVIGLAVAAVLVAGSMQRRSVSLVLAVLGAWGGLLFLGYIGSAGGGGFGGDSSVALGGPFGLLGGVAFLAGSATLLVSFARGGDAHAPAT